MNLFRSDTNPDGRREGAPARRRAFDARRRTFAARLCALAFFVAAASCLFAAARGSSPATRAAARPVAQPSPARPPARTRTQPRRVVRPPARGDYSDFDHASPAHAARDCNACHRIASFEKPDITDYPDHPSCVECHRRQFFRGARPIICSNCHTVVGPRAAARFEFPRRARPSEFADIFPHSNHVKATSLIQFKRILGDKATTTATCQYCHKPDPRDFRKLTNAPAAVYAPEPGTYMTTPTSHATCFQCHWRADVDGREQEPLAAQCAGCHRNADAPARLTNTAAAVATTNTTALVNARAATPAAAAAWPARITAKFVHEDPQHKRRQNDEGKDVPITCLQCHASARKATTLEIFRLRENKVQLQTCSSSACHTAVSGAAQLRTSVLRELRERGKDAKFDCALCHLPPVSTAAEVPCSHYAAVYATAVREKKNTKGVEQLTPARCRDALK